MFVGGLASLTPDPSKLGVRFGMVCSVLAFASLAGPPTAGALIQSHDGSFLEAQIWAGTVTTCAAFFICAAYWTQVKLARSTQHQQPSSGMSEGVHQHLSSLETVQVGDAVRVKA